jgi:O-antigen/teichoic acid export membrane protein
MNRNASGATHVPASPSIPADSLAWGLLLLVALSVLQRGIGLVRNVWICRLMDPQSLGWWNLAMNFLVIAAPFLVLGIPGTFGRYVERYRLRGQLTSFLKSTLRLVLVAAAAGIGLLIALEQPLGQLVFGTQVSRSWMLGCVAVLAVTVVYNVAIELLTALRQPRILSVMHLTNSLLFTALAVGLLSATDWGAMSVVSAFGVASSVALVLGLGLLVHRWRDGSERLPASALPRERQPWLPWQLWGILAPFAAWLWLNDLLANLFMAVDRYMILHFSRMAPDQALEGVGQYHSSFVLGAVVITFGEMVGSIVLPYWVHDWENGRRERVFRHINSSLKLAAVTLTAGSCVILMGSRWLFDQVLQGKYGQGQEILPLALAACCWISLMAMARNYLWLCERPSWVAGVQFAALAVNIVLNAFLLPLFGLWGAVMATMLSSLGGLSLMLAICRLQGLVWSKETMVCMAIPVLLLTGSGITVAALTSLAALVAIRGVLISEEEQQQIASFFRPLVNRFGTADVPPAP